jgi:hypothetical protein
MKNRSEKLISRKAAKHAKFGEIKKLFFFAPACLPVCHTQTGLGAINFLELDLFNN